MEFAGILPEDAPDPRLERAEALKAMPLPVVDLVGQRSLELTDVSLSTGSDGAGFYTMTSAVSSILWRNPDDRSDPVNFAELDDATRRALDEVPPWPRPSWLIEEVERMRYPHLMDAVRTTWHRDESEVTTLDRLLVDHANHILMNQFRELLGLGIQDWDSPALTSERVVRHGVQLVVDGDAVTGAMIDTDPFVYAIGAKLENGGTLTAVVPREHLPYITLKFATQEQE
ncbi:MAG: hypothetical protein WBA87_16465 [Microbacterium sp.]